MTLTLTRSGDRPAASGASDRLLVTRRDPTTRRYSALGFLTRDYAGGFEFAYLLSASERGERPLAGLPSLVRPYRSERLFPIFAERVMSSRRPDRKASLEALGLGLDAAPFEVLQRSGGRRVGDTIELLPAPAARTGEEIQFEFLVHGVRHMTGAAQARIAHLREGELLRLVPEPDNPVQPRALLVTDSDAVQLGYVPDPLLDVIERIAEPVLTVVRASGPEVGFHQRLLVRLSGVLTSASFSGPAWATCGDASN